MFTCLYKGGAELIDGHLAQSKVVPDDQIESHLADGWFLTLAETVEKPQEHKDDAPPTKEEMTQHLESLGVKVDKRWGEDRLAEEIAKAKA